MKISNEGIFKDCPECGGKMELFRFYDCEEHEELPKDFYQCFECSHNEDREYKIVAA